MKIGGHISVAKGLEKAYQDAAESYGAVGAVVHCGKHVDEGSFAAGHWQLETFDPLTEQMKETGYLDHLPVVLETPVDEENEYAEEMVYLHSLREYGLSQVTQEG